MSGVELNGMDLTSLPKLVFAFREGAGDDFAAVKNLDNLIRPAGGLWTSERTLTGSVWTDFLEAPDEVGLPSVYVGKYTGYCLAWLGQRRPTPGCSPIGAPRACETGSPTPRRGSRDPMLVSATVGLASSVRRATQSLITPL